MPFVEGNSGKPKGAVSKTTAKARELFTSIMDGEVENIKEALALVKAESPANYLNILSKFFPYFIPKQLDVTSNGEGLSIPISKWAENGSQEPKV